MKKKKSVPRWLQIVSTIIANAAIVLSIIYIVFYILDGFNPMLHFLGEQVFVTRYLDVIIAALALALGILFLICTWKIFYGKKGKKTKRKGNKSSDAIVMQAAANDKTAFSFDAQHHGFLTYFLLKEIKGIAGQLDSYTYQDIYEAVERKVNKESALQGKWQEISGFVDGKYSSSWQHLKIR